MTDPFDPDSIPPKRVLPSTLHYNMPSDYKFSPAEHLQRAKQNAQTTSFTEIAADGTKTFHDVGEKAQRGFAEALTSKKGLAITGAIIALGIVAYGAKRWLESKKETSGHQR